MMKFVGFLVILSILPIALIGGCVRTPESPPAGGSVCGNDVVEAGEQCESDSDCGTGKICKESCVCESIPTPPTIPE